MKPQHTRVAVTGLGWISPHGCEVESGFQALLDGRSAIAWESEGLLKPAPVARAPFDAATWFTKLQLVGLDRVSQIAVAAAELAVQDAGGREAALPRDRTRLAVYGGCGMGGAAALETAYRSAGRVPPLTVPSFMPNAPVNQVAIRLGAQGAALTYAVACASSAVALAEAAKALQAGEADVVIAGGSEALVVQGVITAWQAMQTLAALPSQGDPSTAVRPFSADRSGFALGEGAAMLVLEQAERAQARGARIYAYLDGWGLSCDATHVTKPDAAGQARALRAALERAGRLPREVGYLNAHGTATLVGDPVEAQALAAVWGADLPGLQVSSTKALHGHLLGAAGALEALITVMAVHRRELPPQHHTSNPDPACGLSLVQAQQFQAPALEAAITSSFAFGGTNAALLFSR